MKIRDFIGAGSASNAQTARAQFGQLMLAKPQPGEVLVLPEPHEKAGTDFHAKVLSDLTHRSFSPHQTPGPDLSGGGAITSGEFDLFDIGLTAGVTYMFNVYGSGADPLNDTYMLLLDFDLTTIFVEDDDGGTGTNSLITFTPTASGVYTLAVSGFLLSDLGTYTLDAVVSPGVDIVPDTDSGAVALDFGVQQYGFIESGIGPYGESEVDTYALNVQDGFYYTIEVAGGADYNSDYFDLPAGELDTFIVLRDADGNIVNFNDDIRFPSDVSSQLSFLAQGSGTYYLDVFSYAPWTGGYAIEVNELNPADYDPLDSIIWASANNVPFQNGIAYVYFGHAGEDFGQTADDGVSPMTTFGWNAYEIAQVMKALEQYEKILGVDYQITGNLSQATFRLATTSSDLYGAYFAPQDPAYGPDQGVGVFNVDSGGWNLAGQSSLAQGGYSFETILHEFGHAHGLAHPHDNGGGSDVMLGVTASQFSYGIYDLNQGVYTVMSYNSSWITGPNGESPFTVAGVGNGWSGTLSAFDIAALQQRYGVVNAYATGNTTYTLKDVQAQGTYYECIWDTGGKDTIKYDGAKNAQIDLLAATIDYSATGGGVMSFVAGIFGGYTIAKGVVIENATGGSGDDNLLGNAANNELKGGAGNDVLVGREGADKLDGGAGFDTASYLTASSGVHASLDGDCGSSGDARGDTFKNIEALQGSNYNDTLEGSKRGDTLSGEGGNDCIGGGDGNDTIYGGAGNDKIDGGKGVDFLYGDEGNDEIDGGKDNDTIVGGAGNDKLYGDSGKDTFVFAIGDGQDKILDFKKSQDIIDFRGTGVTWDELDSNSNNKLDHNDAFVNVVGGHTVIDYGAAAGGLAGLDVLTVSDVKDLKEDSFLF